MDSPKDGSSRKKGITWDDEPEHDYVELGHDVKTIAERYDCSPQMVRAKRKELDWERKRAEHLAEENETTRKDETATPESPVAKEAEAEDSCAEPSASVATVEHPCTLSRDARSPKQLDRQERVFSLSVVSGLTYREIAVELGVSVPTVVEDIKHEQARRSQEIAARREYEATRAISFYEAIIARAIKKSDLNDDLLKKIIGGAEGKVSDRSLESALKARERIDKIMGLEPGALAKVRKIEADATLAEAEVQETTGGAAESDAWVKVEHYVVDGSDHTVEVPAA